tara:strand:+ start:2536 stop:8007 length:5472 start_codon:yes stop_codon:yes gene_type:complete
MPYDEDGKYYESPSNTPLYDEDQKDLFTGMDPHTEDDLPRPLWTGDAYNNKLKAKYWEAGRQALVSGKMTREQFDGMWGQEKNERNLVETIFRLNPHGTDHTILMPSVDLLAHANYAMASWSDARSEAIARDTHHMRQSADNEQQGAFSINTSEWNEDQLPWYDSTRWNPTAFSGSDWLNSYQNRTMYGDVFNEEYNLFGENATAASWRMLALDIALDPYTWTGIGLVGRTIQIGGIALDAARGSLQGAGPVAKAARSAAKSAGIGVRSMDDIAEGMASANGITLKTNAWGEAIRKHATDKVFQENMEKLAVTADEAGEAIHPHASKAASDMVEQDVPRVMIEMYDEIAPLVFKGYKARIENMFKGNVEKAHQVVNDMFFGGKATPLDLGRYPPASAMFQETSSFWRKELGVTTFGLAGWTGKAALSGELGGVKYGLAHSVDWNWVHRANMDPTAKTAYTAIRDSHKASAIEWERGINKAFGGYSKAERATITEILEAAGQGTARNVEGRPAVTYDPRLVEASKQAKLIFDDIAEEEKKYGILNETLGGYVAHLFNGDVRKMANYREVLNKRGSSLTNQWDSKLNPFALHRRIASIDEIKRVFGEESVIDDVSEILFRRKRMSLEMLAQKKWLLDIEAQHGFGRKLLEAAKSGVPKDVSRMMQNRQSSGYSLSDLRQYWVREEIDLSKWGFREGATRDNRHLLRWMTSDTATRGSANAWMRTMGSRNFVATDTLRNYSGKINPNISFKAGGRKLSVNANKYVDALFDSHGSFGRKNATQTPAMVDAADSLGYATFDDIPIGTHRKILEKFDSRARKEFGPLSQVVPDINNIFSPAGNFRSTWARSRIGGEPRELQNLLKSLNKAEDIKIVPGLKEEVAMKARQLRRSLGDYSDTLKPTSQVLGAVKALLKEGSVNTKATEELLQALFNKKTLDRLSAYEADALETFVGMNLGKDKYVARMGALIGEDLVKVKIPAVLGRRPTLVSTNVSDLLPGVQKSLDNSMEISGRMGKALKVNRAVLAGWESKKRIIRDLIRDEKAARAKLNKVNQKKNAVAWLNAKYGLDDATKAKEKFIADFGDSVKIDGHIKEVTGKIKVGESKINKVRSSSLYHKRVKSWLNAENAAISNPADKILRRSANRAKKKVRNWESKNAVPPENAAQAPSARVAKVPQKQVSDPRVGIGEVGGFEKPVFHGEKLAGVHRTPGNIGPQITAAGETLESFRYGSYYLPKSMAKMLDDINTPLYGHKLARLFKGYDYTQAYFKARVMAMFPEFHKRNAVTDLALAHLRAGMGLLHPGHWNDYSKIITYGLQKESASIARITGSAATSGAVLGAEVGAVAGSVAGYREGEGFVDTTAKMVGGALEGAVLGGGALAVGGGAFGGVLGVASKVGQTHRKAFVAGAKKFGIKTDARPLAEQMVKLDNGIEFTVAEFYNEMMKRGIFNTQISEEVLKESGGALFAMASARGKTITADAIGGVNKKQAIFMQDTFRAGEMASTIPIRAMLFTQVAKESGNLQVAAQVVKKYLYDYSNLTMFERRVMRRAIPFYTWTKHALGANYEALKHNPSRWSQQLKPFTSMAKDDGVDPSDYPDWLSNRLARFQVKLDPETGERRVTAKQGYGLVQEELIGVWKDLSHMATAADPWTSGKPSDQKSRIASRGPFLLTPLMEAAANFDTFRQGNILASKGSSSAYEGGKEWDNAPEWMQKALGYERDPVTGRSKVDPRASWMLREIPQSRVFTITKQVYDMDEDGARKINYVALARAVLGEKVYTYGPNNALYEDRARIERTAQWLSNIRVLKPMVISVPTDKKKKSSKPKRLRPTY